MKFQDKKLENGQAQWIVTIEGQEWKEAIKKAKKILSQNVEIKGFRKGKAPKSEVEKQLTPVKIYNQAFTSLVSPAFDYALEQKSALEPFTSPIPSPIQVDEKSLTISYTFELKPEIEIGQYKNLKIKDLKKEPVNVSNEEIDNALKQYQNRFAMETAKPADGKIEKGDLVTFDFTGYVDGTAFPGGDAKNYKLEIGSGQFIPGFEDQMIGLSRGDDQSINVKFPTGYSENLSDKDAEFKLNIHEIATKELPPIDDELAKDLGIKEVNTIAELKEKIKTDIEAQKTASLKNGFVDRVIMEVIKDSKISFPKTVLAQQVKHLWDDLEKSLQKEGMTLKDYKANLGLTDEAINAQLEDDAKNELSVYLVTSEISKKENLSATEEEINSKFAEFSKLYGVSEEQLKTILRPDQVRDEIVNEKLINFLYENN